MAVDTRNKRISIIGLGLPWRGLLPLPDGTISEADRSIFLKLFKEDVDRQNDAIERSRTSR